MKHLVDELRIALPAAFERDEYRARREVLDQQQKAHSEEGFGGLQQRADVKKLNDTLESTLTTKGMVINKTEPDTFRDQLRKSGFYKEWKGKFGDKTWALLEESAGKPL